MIQGTYLEFNILTFKSSFKDNKQARADPPPAIYHPLLALQNKLLNDMLHAFVIIRQRNIIGAFF